ncbi:hypothetical protein, partial [Pseudomonas sp. zfem002]|uniref:hypothetical protein n=1 Tax=Pseudomonas sp. zfem002 TaxID=3078197 RepID=UPI002927B1C4
MSDDNCSETQGGRRESAVRTAHRGQCPLPVCPAWAKISHLKAVTRMSDDNCSETQGGRREAKLKEAR